MAYEYKCVGGPERVRRTRGTTRTERVAHAMQELIEIEAARGWEYLRTDLIPVEEKPSFLAQSREVHRAVLVFRRTKPGADAARRLHERVEPTSDATFKLAAERTVPDSAEESIRADVRQDPAQR